MGVLDVSKDDLRRPGVDEPFVEALQRCMSGGGGDSDAATPGGEGVGDGEAAAASAASTAPPAARRKIVQDADGADRRRAFGQLYEELGELAFKYYFTIPSCMPRRRASNPRRADSPSLLLTRSFAPHVLEQITSS